MAIKSYQKSEKAHQACDPAVTIALWRTSGNVFFKKKVARRLEML